MANIISPSWETSEKNGHELTIDIFLEDRYHGRMYVSHNTPNNANPGGNFRADFLRYKGGGTQKDRMNGASEISRRRRDKRIARR